MIVEFFRKKSALQCCPNARADKRLNKHPQLKRSNEALLDVVENVENFMPKASQAEQIVTDEIQQIGQQARKALGFKPAKRVSFDIQEAHPFATKHGKKKLYWHTTFFNLQVTEQLYLQEGHQKRTVSQIAEVTVQTIL